MWTDTTINASYRQTDIKYFLCSVGGQGFHSRGLIKEKGKTGIQETVNTFKLMLFVTVKVVLSSHGNVGSVFNSLQGEKSRPEDFMSPEALRVK